VKDRDIDDILKRAADAAPPVDPALLDRVSRSIGAGLQPVRPLPPSWIWSGGLVLISAVLALAAAMLLKPYGVSKMSLLEIALIFPVLGVMLWMASVLCVAEAIPGSRRPMAPWLLSACCCLALAAVFGLLFDDYRTERFVSRGVACLTAGLVIALPASIAAWLLLSRGFAVNSAAAGLAKGTLAGLAGVAMLALHCPIFEAPHVLVWHIAVLPVCGVAGALLGRMASGARHAAARVS
jgi:hypothetical protein